MDNQYLEVVRRVEKHLGASKPDAGALQNLRAQIAAQPWTINFDAAADTYNSFYWVRNFWKAAYFLAYEYSLTPTALNRLAKRQMLDVTFVGGGSGADVLAFITWFNNAFPLNKLRVTLIDGSQKQLDTAARFIAETSELFDQTDLRVRYLHMHTDHWQPAINSTDVLVLGHFLVENPAGVHTILLKSRDAVRRGGDIVIIERPDDTVVHHARQVLANAGLTIHDVTTHDGRMSLIRDNMTNLGRTGISSHYLRAIQPDRKRKAEIVSTYFAAWRQQAVEPIHDIFDQNGSYTYKVDQLYPINNVEEMLKYWRAKPMAQSDIKVLIRNATYTENVAICTFDADFDTPHTHEVVKGAISFEIDAYSNKIRRMRGHYGVVKTLR